MTPQEELLQGLADLHARQAPARAEIARRLGVLDQELTAARGRLPLLDPWGADADDVEHLFPAAGDSPVVSLSVGEFHLMACWQVTVHSPSGPGTPELLGPEPVRGALRLTMTLEEARTAAEEKARAAGWLPVLRGATFPAARAALPPELEGMLGQEGRSQNRTIYDLRGPGPRRARLEVGRALVKIVLSYEHLPCTDWLPVYDLACALRAAQRFLRG